MDLIKRNTWKWVIFDLGGVNFTDRVLVRGIIELERVPVEPGFYRSIGGSHAAWVAGGRQIDKILADQVRSDAVDQADMEISQERFKMAQLVGVKFNRARGEIASLAIDDEGQDFPGNQVFVVLGGFGRWRHSYFDRSYKSGG